MLHTIQDTDNKTALGVLVQNDFVVDGMKISFSSDYRQNNQAIKAVTKLSEMTHIPKVSIEAGVMPSDDTYLHVVDGKFKMKLIIWDMEEEEAAPELCCDSPFINMDLNYGDTQYTHNKDFYSVKFSNHIALQERTYYADINPHVDKEDRFVTLDEYLSREGFTTGATFQVTTKDFGNALKYQKGDGVHIRTLNGYVSIVGDNGGNAIETTDCTTEGATAKISPRMIRKVLTKIGKNITVTLLNNTKNIDVTSLLIECSETKRKALILGQRG